MIMFSAFNRWTNHSQLIQSKCIFFKTTKLSLDIWVAPVMNLSVKPVVGLTVYRPGTERSTRNGDLQPLKDPPLPDSFKVMLHLRIPFSKKSIDLPFSFILLVLFLM